MRTQSLFRGQADPKGDGLLPTQVTECAVDVDDAAGGSVGAAWRSAAGDSPTPQRISAVFVCSPLSQVLLGLNVAWNLTQLLHVNLIKRLPAASTPVATD
eukprot:3255360-Rhodomonas_salina.1